jgi:hypothetical protein
VDGKTILPSKVTSQQIPFQKTEESRFGWQLRLSAIFLLANRLLFLYNQVGYFRLEGNDQNG